MADNIQIKDASGVARNMRTSDDGTAHTPHHIVDDLPAYDATTGRLLVGTSRDKFRDDFFAFDTVGAWELVQIGAGMTIGVAGSSGGARYLAISTGTTASSETILQSRASFRLPLKLGFAVSLSQRIANQEFFVELVGVDANGNVETDTTFPSTDSNNALNVASWKFDGTTATQAKYLVRGQGVSDLLSAAVTIGTTVATGSSPNFLPTSVMSINADMEEAVFTTQLVDSLAVIPNIYKRTQYIPDAGKAYKIRIRVKNLSTAPASTTDVRLHFARVLDTTRFTVDFARHMGRGTDVADALPVYLAGAGTLTARFENGGALASAAANALTKVRVTAAATTNATSVKASAGRLYGLHLCNLAAAVRFVKFYNKASAPTVGTDTPVATYPLPTGTRLDVDLLSGISFSTGIAYAITGAVADTDTTAIAANDVVGELLYA